MQLTCYYHVEIDVRHIRNKLYSLLPSSEGTPLPCQDPECN